MDILEFPEAIRSIVSEFDAQRETTTLLRTHFRTGKSGAFVGLVDCQGGHDGVFVLKVSNRQEGEQEAIQHQRALTIGAFHNKLPTIIDTYSTDTLFLILLKIAGGSLLTWRPLVDSLHLLASGYSTLANTLWSPDLMTLANQSQSAELVSQLLGYRLSPHTGRILHHARTYLGHEIASSPAFHHLGEVLPNPLYFATQPSLCAAPVLRPLVGPQHGDCHAANLIVQTGLDGSVRDIALIDLAFFSDSAPIFYDTSYFELATLLRTMDDLGQDRWFQLASLLSASVDFTLNTLTQFERAWALDLLSARKTITNLITTCYPDRNDDLHLQILLTHVASGLAFLNKRPRQQGGSIGLSLSQYRESFIWSALHLRQFFELTQVKWIPTSTQIPPLGLQTAFSSMPNAAAWRDLVSFDQRSFNILVLSPLFRSANDSTFQKLMRLPWNLVIDLGTSELPPDIVAPHQRSIRQAWPNGPQPDLSTTTRSMLWYFANGRLDISDAIPTQGLREWRQKHLPQLQDLLRAVAQRNAPASVRCLVVGDDLSQDLLRHIVESLDCYVGQVAAPILITCANAQLLQDIPIALAPFDEFLNALAAVQVPPLTDHDNTVLLPHRSETGTLLRHVDATFVARIEKDLTVVHPGLAESFPPDREFGVTFRRGGLIEWAELDNSLDVPRDAMTDLLKSARGELAKSTNSTINLLHEPSAGATTLSRRIAWEMMQEHPVAFIEQLSPMTAEYISELSQECGLPVLVIMEAEVVTESRREILFRELLDNNTRAVLLWVSRVYGEYSDDNVLKAELSDAEASRFQKAYGEGIPIGRTLQLTLLTYDPTLREQRNPFFYGLAAFEDTYLGLDKLVEATLSRLDDRGRALIIDLAFVSLYCSDGFPKAEYDELCGRLNEGERPFLPDTPFAVMDWQYIKIPHRLIAIRALIELARAPNIWKADLGMWAVTLLNHLRMLNARDADRIKEMVTSIFVTRDTSMILGTDSDIAAGFVSHNRPFAPLLHDIGSVEMSRRVLRKVFNDWPNEPHFAVHYARHLLYEQPKDIDGAESAVTMSYRGSGHNDNTVAHTLGMCHRTRLKAIIDSAREHSSRFTDIERNLETEANQAMRYFAEASELDQISEYGHLSTIQTAATLLRSAAELSKMDLAGILKDPQHRWLVSVLGRAEDSINMLRSRTLSRVSIRAKNAIAQWGMVYGNIDKVVAQLRDLSRNYEDSSVRRALCSAIMTKYGRKWRAMPDAELQTIVSLMERNIDSTDFSDSDLSRWLRAYRMRRVFDIEHTIERLIDWSNLRPDSIEPVFYLYVFYFIRWLNSQRNNQGYVDSIGHWLNLCREKRPLGVKRWSHEWLISREHHYSSVHYGDLEFDPVQILIGRAPEHLDKLRHLPRVEGTLVRYIGRQHALVDIGQKLTVHITPRMKIVKEHEGRRISTLISFSYDGPIGWDPLVL